jgi:putative DNA primase/helicase
VTDRLQKVRAIMDSPEEIGMEGVAAPSAAADDPEAWRADLGDPGPQDDPGAGAPPEAPGPGGSSDEDPEGPVARSAKEELNDTGNAARLIHHFGPDLLYVPELGPAGWHTWAGTHWENDASALAVRSKAQAVWPLIRQEARFMSPGPTERPHFEERQRLRDRAEILSRLPVELRGPDEGAELAEIAKRLIVLQKLLAGFATSVGDRLKWAKATGNTARIDAMLTESRPRLAVRVDQLDALPLDLNCLSGLLRFSVSEPGEEGGGKVADVQLIPHDRAHLITKCIPVAYDPRAEAPLFDAFLSRIQPDREMRLFLQRWLGLSLTAQKTSHVAFFYGSGANGKSVLVDIVAKILAGYSTTLKVESITGSNQRTGAQATPDLIPLVGARFVRVSEPEQGTPLQEGTVKAMTGGEPIPVRPNYGEQFQLDPTFKLTLSGNHKPDIKGGDDGIWRRVLLVPFDVQIPASERDERLVAKLWAERAGILRWLVEGVIMVLEEGLCPPAAVREATDDYREESDPLGAFLMTCCNITGRPEDRLGSKAIVEAFNYYLLERGNNTRQPTTITKAVRAKSRQWRHPETGRQFAESKRVGIAGYSGLMFTTEFKRRLDAAPRDQRGVPSGVAAETPDPDAAY